MSRSPFKVFLTCLVLAVSGCDSTVNIQDPNSSFYVKFFGNDGNQTGADLVQLPDGTFVLFGTTTPSGSGQTSQWYLVKVDSRGMIMLDNQGKRLERKFGSPALDETASDIEITSDNNRLVLVGNVHQTPANRDVRIMTLTTDLNPIDSAVIPIRDAAGVDQGKDENAASVTETFDGGFIIAGSTTYVTSPPAPGVIDLRDAIYLRVDKFLKDYTLDGWRKNQSYGVNTDDVSKKIFQVPDSGFISFGFTNDKRSGQTVFNYNPWYYKLSKKGLPGNAKILGAESKDEKPSAVLRGSSGNYFVAGLVFDQSGVANIYVSNLQGSSPFVLDFLDSDEKWQQSYAPNLGIVPDEKTSIFVSGTRGIYVLTNEISSGNNQNWLLTKVDEFGSPATLWTIPIIFGGEGPDNIGGVLETTDGRIVMIGTMRTGKPDAGETKMTMIKVNQDGKFEK